MNHDQAREQSLKCSKKRSKVAVFKSFFLQIYFFFAEFNRQEIFVSQKDCHKLKKIIFAFSQHTAEL